MEALIAYARPLGQGALVTIGLAVLSLALATLLGALGAYGRLGGGRLGAGLVLAYTTIVRGIPDLVVILLVYFGGQRLVNTLAAAFGADTGFQVSPFLAGVVSIGFIYGAYLTETFRGAYMTVPRGQIEAARALGLRSLPLLWTVTLPQLIRAALSGYANVFQVLVKSTAVVSVIGLADIVGIANSAGKSVREPFAFFAAVMVFYLLLTWASTTIFDALERRYATGFADAR